MKGRTQTIILAGVLAVAIAFTLLLYLYPAKNLNPLGSGSGNQSATSYLQSPNQAAVSNFLKAYNFSNITNLRGFYQVSNSNEMIFDCNSGVIALQTLSIPAILERENSSAYGIYAHAISDVSTLTLCGLGIETTGCQAAKSALYNLSLKYMNYSMTYALFNRTAEFIKTMYDAVTSFNENSSFLAPVYYDEGLLNSTNTSKPHMLTALIDLKALPSLVIDQPNGSVVGILNSVVEVPKNDSIASVVSGEFYVPFQFPTILYPAAPKCGPPATVFNLISDSNNFDAQTYASIYSGLNAKVINICINSSSNSCSLQAMKGLGASFYVQS